MFKNLIKKIRGSSDDYKRKTIFPDRDWSYMVLFMVLVVLVFGALGFLFFNKVSSGSFWQINSEIEVKEYKLNKNNLNNFYKYINEKQDRLDSSDSFIQIPNPFI